MRNLWLLLLETASSDERWTTVVVFTLAAGMSVVDASSELVGEWEAGCVERARSVWCLDDTVWFRNVEFLTLVLICCIFKRILGTAVLFTVVDLGLAVVLTAVLWAAVEGLTTTLCKAIKRRAGDATLWAEDAGSWVLIASGVYWLLLVVVCLWEASCCVAASLLVVVCLLVVGRWVTTFLLVVVCLLAVG